MILFDKNSCLDICLKNTNKYVKLAVEDLASDLCRKNINNIKPNITSEETKNCILIEENSIADANAIDDESYSIKCNGEKITISATSYLGTIWGIYTISEKILGIDPCYLFNDLETKKIDSLEIPEFNFHSKPSGFKFRGIFINDEDLLTGWHKGGPRFIEYNFYATTVVPSVMDMIVETALRLKMNLIIPASFLDIDNPFEKDLADCVAKRGIFISQHHIEPLGVSHFSFNNYCKKHSIDGAYSYMDNPHLLEEVWTYYVKKWSQYENVLWQVGLRGKADRPVWEEAVPTEDELKKYGEYISNAISKECEIVKKHTNSKSAYFTTTLWMEGSTLAEKGFLTFDNDVCLIFSDNGPNQMYGNEYNKIPRDSDTKYGIYYHLQYYDIGPHLAPQTTLEKLDYNIKKAYQKRDNHYAIINASNIREFTFELNAVAKLLYDTESFDINTYLDEYCNTIYGANIEEAKECITAYYQKLPSLDTKLLCNVHAKYFNYSYDEEVPFVKNFILKDGLIILQGKQIIRDFDKPAHTVFNEQIYNELKVIEPIYSTLIEKFKTLANKSESAAKLHTTVKWQLHCVTLHSIYLWYINLFEAHQFYAQKNINECKKILQKAVDAIENYLEFRKKAEYGIFKNWYCEEIKLNLEMQCANTKNLLNGLTPIDWQIEES